MLQKIFLLKLEVCSEREKGEKITFFDVVMTYLCFYGINACNSNWIGAGLQRVDGNGSHNANFCSVILEIAPPVMASVEGKSESASCSGDLRTQSSLALENPVVVKIYFHFSLSVLSAWAKISSTYLLRKEKKNFKKKKTMSKIN